jgi:hypothetical protein
MFPDIDDRTDPNNEPRDFPALSTMIQPQPEGRRKGLQLFGRVLQPYS